MRKQSKRSRKVAAAKKGVHRPNQRAAGWAAAMKGPKVFGPKRGGGR